MTNPCAYCKSHSCAANCPECAVERKICCTCALILVDNLPAYQNHRVLGVKCAWIEWALERPPVEAILGIWVLAVILVFLIGLAVTRDVGVGVIAALWFVGCTFVAALLLLLWSNIVRRKYQKVCDVMNVLGR